MHRVLCAMVIILIDTTVMAADSMILAAHEHGVGILDIAIEGAEIHRDREATAPDIVGFELAAENPEGPARVAAARALLTSPARLLRTPGGAGCTATEAEAALVTDEDPTEIGIETADGHGKGGRADNHGGDEAEVERYTDFHAALRLSCQSPVTLHTTDFPAFGEFANVRVLKVGVITGKGGRVFRIERNDAVLNLDGLI